MRSNDRDWKAVVAIGPSNSRRCAQLRQPPRRFRTSWFQPLVMRNPTSDCSAAPPSAQIGYGAASVKERT